MKLTYYYSACVSIETKAIKILCDPWVTQGIYEGAWYHAPKPLDPNILLEQDFDLIWISHIHPDHYDPAFLRLYAATHPNTEIKVSDFKNNYLLEQMKRDGIKALPCRGIITSETTIYCKEQEAGLDAALVVIEGQNSIVNMVDCQTDIEQIKRIKAVLPNGSATIALLPYTGAGPYPQTYYSDHDTLLEKSRELQQEFFRRYDERKALLNPKYTIPFAGQYILGGKLAHLNQYRCAIDAVEVTEHDSDAIVLNSGGTLSLDPYMVTGRRLARYTHDELEARRLEISTYPMAWDADPVPQKVTLDTLLISAVSTPPPDGWTVQFQLLDKTIAFGSGDNLLCLYVDPRLLYRLLTGRTNWWDAMIGSLFEARRTPDAYEPALDEWLANLTISIS